MRYAISYTERRQEYRLTHAATPLKALHAALDLRTNGFMPIGLTDLETGAEYGVEEFAHAHDLAAVLDSFPKPPGERPQGPSHS